MPGLLNVKMYFSQVMLQPGMPGASKRSMTLASTPQVIGLTKPSGGGALRLAKGYLQVCQLKSFLHSRTKFTPPLNVLYMTLYDREKLAMRLTALIATMSMLFAAPAAADDLTPAKANALCRDLIDARDYAIFKAASDQSIELVYLNLRSGGEPPTFLEAMELSALLHAVNTDLTAALEAMQALPASSHRDAFLAYGQSKITVNEARIGFLADPDTWQWPLSETIDPTPPHSEEDARQLGFLNRDCNYLFGSFGNPPELANFIPLVAPACSIAYHNLLVTDLDVWREQNMNALLALRRGKPQDPKTIPALRSLAYSWANALGVFLLADRELTEKPAHWQEALDVMAENARIFAARANAIESGDEETIALTFERRPAPVDFRSVGLEETSCMALIQLM